VKYVIIVLSSISFLLGGYLGRQLFPRDRVREVPVVTTKTNTVTQTRTIERFPDGHTVEKVVVQTRDKATASAQPAKPQYRAGLLLPLSNDRLPTVSASKRLFGSVWADAQYDLRHKEITLGVSIEF
jgi:hypothetical protein